MSKKKICLFIVSFCFAIINAQDYDKFIGEWTTDKSDIILSAVRDIDQTLELCEGHNGLFKLNSDVEYILIFFGNKLLISRNLPLLLVPMSNLSIFCLNI